ncbi:MAG: N-6 DNA methylase [Bifidobacteriaceae bacterium]|nr:N-6 DNA methylase [Bifidobacteriaceae bacterium]
MITKATFPKLLKHLEFTDDKEGKYEKVFDVGKASEFKLAVDTRKQEFIYPDGVRYDRATTITSFHQNESFVVFECVNRLFELHYHPEDITLEFKLQTNKLNWADIRISDRNDNCFALIECKTPGKEYGKAKKRLEMSGGQLFDYAQVLGHTDENGERRFPNLVLYTSDFIKTSESKINEQVFENYDLSREYQLVILNDNESYLNDNKQAESYALSNNSRELYQVWQGTYRGAVSSMGMFEKDIEPFNVGKKFVSINDLLNSSNTPNFASILARKYHTFREILRKYNVSGRENAFDKLLNLLLAKVVDELEVIESAENKEKLDFYWHTIAFDDRKDLFDRLQKLYRKGMWEHMSEKVEYVSREEVRDAFKFVKTDPDATLDKIQEKFDRLRFYSNNYFSFLDVYNEVLFEQNAEILIQVVEMLEDLQITSKVSHQFLGDFFENFLNDGVKQSEGQFFTPTPIVRFLVSSLPLKEIIEQNEIPKVIDYACGAGHFLNEYATQIAHYVDDDKQLSKHYSEIYGIEKESRLAKVAKVSALMYGQKEIKIKYADALTDVNGIEDNSFSVLIANPPYSVKGFLETIEDYRENYDAYNNALKEKHVPTNDDIEVFFLEKAAKLLKPSGVATVILPISILNSHETIFIEGRNILLKNFDIIAIFESGATTFGKTGVVTSTLFLRKKSDNPSSYDQYKNRVEKWFNDKKIESSVFRDKKLFQQYCKKVKLTSKKVLANKTHKERLLCFMLAKNNPCPVLIVKTPSEKTGDTAEKFLGYGWSNRKGNEGIGILAGDISQIQTPLFDPDNLYLGTGTINGLIRKNFNGETVNIPKHLEKYVSVNYLEDMIDWQTPVFHKVINLTNESGVGANEKIDWNTEYPLKAIGQFLTDKPISGSRPKGGVKNIENGALSIGGEHIDSTSGYINLSSPKYVPHEYYKSAKESAKLKVNDILICKDGAQTGKVALVRNEFANEKVMVNEHIFILRVRENSDVLQKYLFYMLLSETGQALLRNAKAGAAQGGINQSAVENIQIPVPPIDVQEKIIADYEEVEQQEQIAKEQIADLSTQISSIMDNLRGGGAKI